MNENGRHFVNLANSRLLEIIHLEKKVKEQAKEIEVLNQSYEILFKHRIEQEKKIVDLEEQLRPLKSVNWDINNPSLRFINNA